MTTSRQHAIKHAGELVEPMLPLVGKVIEKAMQGVLEQCCDMHFRIKELEDLLTSAHAIAKRNGDDVNWERFASRISAAGIGSVTAKTFRILPGDDSAPQKNKLSGRRG